MKKLICIIFSMLVILSYTSIAINISDSDDVPVWNVDDSWTYTISDFTLDLKDMYLTGDIDDFKWTVVNTNGDTYKVEFTGKLNCIYIFQINNKSITGRLKHTLNRLTGTIEFSKSNLEICSMSAEIKGITKVRISSFPIPIPLPFRISVDINFLPSNFPLYQFPLYEYKTWDMPNITVGIDANIGDLFGIFTYPINFELEIPNVPNLFTCNEKQDVTVEAGTFESYKIALLHEYTGLHYYYSPSARNLVKMDFHIENSDIFVNLYGELKSLD